MSLNTNFCSISVVNSSNTSIDICLAPTTHPQTHLERRASGEETVEAEVKAVPLFSLTVDPEQLVKPIVIRISSKTSSSPSQVSQVPPTEYSVTESDSSGHPQVWFDEAKILNRNGDVDTPKTASSPSQVSQVPPTEYSVTESDSTGHPQVWFDEAKILDRNRIVDASANTINLPVFESPHSKQARVQTWCAETQFFADVADALYGSWPGSPTHPRVSKVDPSDVEYLRSITTPSNLNKIAEYYDRKVKTEAEGEMGDEGVPTSEDDEVSLLPPSKKLKYD